MRNYISSEELAKIEFDLGSFVASCNNSCNNLNEKDFEGEFIVRVNRSCVSVTRNFSSYYLNTNLEPTTKSGEI